VLAEEAELGGKGDVKVDSFAEADAAEPEHMRITMDPRKAWVKPAPSNGHLKGAGVNTGEEHHDFGDVHVTLGEVSPVHVPVNHTLADAGVNVGDDSLLHVDKGPQVYVPDSVPMAAPRKTKQHKLDKLGVNTGDEHTQWGDSMVSHEGLEVRSGGGGGGVGVGVGVGVLRKSLCKSYEGLEVRSGWVAAGRGVGWW